MNQNEAQSVFESGWHLEKSGKFAAAESMYRTAIELSEPGEPSWHFRLGKSLYEISKMSDAEASLRTAITLSESEKPHHYLYLGMALEEQGKVEEATHCLEMATELQTNVVNRFDAWFARLAGCLITLKRWPDAEKALQRAIDLNSTDGRYYRRLGEVLRKQKKWGDAGKAYAAAAELLPTSVEAYLNSGDCYCKSAQWARAADAYSEAIAAAPKVKVEWYRKLAGTLKRAKIWRRQIEALERVIQLEGAAANVSDRFDLAEALEAMGRFDDAIGAYELAIAAGEPSARMMYRLGFAYEQAGKAKAAEAAYARAVALEPKAAFQGVAWFHAQRGLWKEAAKALELQVQAKPVEAELRYRLGLAYDRCYQWLEARDAYLDALALNPKNFYWHYRLGFVYERLEDWGNAAEAYAESIALRQKKTADTCFRLGYALNFAGRQAEAVEAWLEVFPEEKRLTEFLSPSAGDRTEDRDAVFVETMDPCTSLTPYLTDLARRRTEVLGRALEYNATSLDVWIKRAEQYEQLNCWSESAAAYAQVVARDNDQSAIWYYRLGQALVADNRIDEACAAFLQMRAYRRPYGLDEAIVGYEKSSSLREAMDYVEAFETLPLQPDTVLFESYFGANISCNPLAICAHMMSETRFDHFTYVWVINDRDMIPQAWLARKNMIFVTRGTRLYRKYLATAEYLVNNVTFPPFFIRRDDQKYLNTWHGTPLKSLGKEMTVDGKVAEHKNVSRNFLHATHLISPNRHTSNVLIKSYDLEGLYPGKLAETGYPRQDTLVSTVPGRREAFFEALDLDPSRPVILYAPTWRGQPGTEKTDFDRLVADLDHLAVQGHQVVFRGHHMMEKSLLNVDVPVSVVPHDISTYDLLPCVDALITDYSSILFDFIPLKRPIFYYAYDLEGYIATRGKLYFDLNDLPGFVCRDIETLSDGLGELTQQPYAPDERHQAALASFCPFDDGKASARTVAFFIEGKDKDVNLIEKPSDARLPVLMFGGQFIPNGITSSCLNLLQAIDPEQFRVAVAVDPETIGPFPERVKKLTSIPSHVQVLGRVGRMLQTPEEKWVIDKFNAQDTLASPAMWAVHDACYRREFRRVFGYSQWQAVINFEGYHRFWGSIFANPGTQAVSHSTFMHNDMMRECVTRFPYLKGMFQLYDRFDTTISVSGVMADVNRSGLAELYNLPAESFRYCPNIIDGERILTLAEEESGAEILDWVGASPFFITLGRLSVEKDHAKLIHAFSAVLPYFPEIKLVILGEGPLRHELAQLIRNQGLEASVLLAGQLENPFPLLKRADCFVLSSNHEGQPMVLLEAMVLGKPIIATDIDGNRGVLEPGYGALVTNDVGGMTQGMLDFLEGKLVFEGFDHEVYRAEAIRMFLKNAIYLTQ